MPELKTQAVIPLYVRIENSEFRRCRISKVHVKELKWDNTGTSALTDIGQYFIHQFGHQYRIWLEFIPKDSKNVLTVAGVTTLAEAQKQAKLDYFKRKIKQGKHA